jgi:hypothetical protein
MTNSVVIPVNSATEAYTIVMELKGLGLVANSDFTWSFKPKTEDYISYEVIDPPSVTFTFIDESMASFFRLKWSRND